MKLFEVAIPPGVVRLGTELQSSGRWWDCNLVRWVEGTLQPIGGWAALYSGVDSTHLTVTGKARAAHSWRTNSNVPFMAIGTHSHLYVYTGLELFDITPVGLAPGREDTESFTGYGIGIYGRGTYGTQRQTAGATEVATTWSLDNFGQDLLAVHSDDGRLMRWLGDPAFPALPVVATTGTIPINNKLVMVTEERFCMLLGASGDPRRIQWSSAEDYTAWAISAVTSAGFLTLQTPGVIKACCKVRKQNLIVTNLDAHVANYVGYPAFYGLDRVATGCGIIGSKALESSDDVAYWMGQGGFYKYDGAVTVLPCAVREYVFNSLNIGQAEKVYAIRLPGLSSIKWFYPSGSSIECDRYVEYNYLLDVWSFGNVARTCGRHKGVFTYPVYVDPAGKLWAHEQGRDYTGEVPWIESGPVEIGDGGRVYDLLQILPDERTAGQVQARFRSRYWPNGPESAHGPYSLTSPTSIRFSGREISVRVESAGNHDWRVGRFRFDHTLRGAR